MLPAGVKNRGRCENSFASFQLRPVRKGPMIGGGGGGGGGGFFLAGEDLGSVRPFTSRLRFFFFFLEWGWVEISPCALIPLYMQGSVHSDSEN